MLASCLPVTPVDVQATNMGVLADILREDVNLAVWQREPAEPVTGFARALLDQGYQLADAFSVPIEPGDKGAILLPGLARCAAHLDGHQAFLGDVAQLVSAFACLFDVRLVGLRLRTLETGMCPRWHVDRVPVRLITSYAGPGSQWLEEGQLPRRYLGVPAVDQHAEAARPCSLQAGDVALLKGERWQGNEGRGVIHRSPPLQQGERRLLLTLDWLD